MDVKRDDDDATIVSRQTRGSTCCHHQRLPQLPSKESNGRDVWRRTLIIFIEAMVAGGDDGLLRWQIEVVMVWWQVAMKKVLK
jgi:hypothetical protein